MASLSIEALTKETEPEVEMASGDQITTATGKQHPSISKMSDTESPSNAAILTSPLATSPTENPNVQEPRELLDSSLSSQVTKTCISSLVKEKSVGDPELNVNSRPKRKSTENKKVNYSEFAGEAGNDSEAQDGSDAEAMQCESSVRRRKGKPQKLMRAKDQVMSNIQTALDTNEQLPEKRRHRNQTSVMKSKRKQNDDIWIVKGNSHTSQMSRGSKKPGAKKVNMKFTRAQTDRGKSNSGQTTQDSDHGEVKSDKRRNKRTSKYDILIQNTETKLENKALEKYSAPIGVLRDVSNFKNDWKQLWCQECGKLQHGECSEHGPLLLIPDRRQLKAYATLPRVVTIRNISSKKKSKFRPDEKEILGVYAIRKVQKNYRFGPLEGKYISFPKDFDLTSKWLLFRDIGNPLCLETSDVESCNWMMFIRRTTDIKEQNVTAFQYGSDIYYVTTRDVAEGEELRFYYSDNYYELLMESLPGEIMEGLPEPWLLRGELSRPQLGGPTPKGNPTPSEVSSQVPDTSRAVYQNSKGANSKEHQMQGKEDSPDLDVNRQQVVCASVPESQNEAPMQLGEDADMSNIIRQAAESHGIGPEMEGNGSSSNIISSMAVSLLGVVPTVTQTQLVPTNQQLTLTTLSMQSSQSQSHITQQDQMSSGSQQQASSGLMVSLQQPQQQQQPAYLSAVSVGGMSTSVASPMQPPSNSDDSLQAALAFARGDYDHQVSYTQAGQQQQRYSESQPGDVRSRSDFNYDTMQAQSASAVDIALRYLQSLSEGNTPTSRHDQSQSQQPALGLHSQQSPYSATAVDSVPASQMYPGIAQSLGQGQFEMTTASYAQCQPGMVVDLQHQPPQQQQQAGHVRPMSDLLPALGTGQSTDQGGQFANLNPVPFEHIQSVMEDPSQRYQQTAPAVTVAETAQLAQPGAQLMQSITQPLPILQHVGFTVPMSRIVVESSESEPRSKAKRKRGLKRAPQQEVPVQAAGKVARVSATDVEEEDEEEDKASEELELVTLTAIAKNGEQPDEDDETPVICYTKSEELRICASYAMMEGINVLLLCIKTKAPAKKNIKKVSQIYNMPEQLEQPKGPFTQLSDGSAPRVEQTVVLPELMGKPSEESPDAGYTYRYILPPGWKSSYVCTRCGRVFRMMSLLRNHWLSHTNVRSHLCEICGQGFKNYPCLRRHIEIHDKTREIKYFCTQCGKGFFDQYKCRRHEMIHTGEHYTHKCPICDRKFSSSTHLKRHRLIHDGIKPFQCPLCDRKFTQKSDMLKHAALHEKYTEPVASNKSVTYITPLPPQNGPTPATFINNFVRYTKNGQGTHRELKGAAILESNYHPPFQ